VLGRQEGKVWGRGREGEGGSGISRALGVTRVRLGAVAQWHGGRSQVHSGVGYKMVWRAAGRGMVRVW